MYLRNLEEAKIYTITFDVNEAPRLQKVKCIKVLVKLTNSMKISDLETSENQWINSNVQIQLFDEVPEKYFRKEKLQKIKDKENDNEEE